MSFLMRQVAHCDVCGHEWLVIAKNTPTHCAACKSRKWNAFAAKTTGPVPEPKWMTEERSERERKPIRNRPKAAPFVVPKSGRPDHAKTCKCLMCKPPK